MLPPLPRCSRRAQTSLELTRPYQPSPIWWSGRPAHRPFRGLLSVHSRCGLHTRTVTYVTVIRGLHTLRHLHACPGCFRLELLAGWDPNPLESPPLHGAHQSQSFTFALVKDRFCRKLPTGHFEANCRQAPSVTLRIGLGHFPGNCRCLRIAPSAIRLAASDACAGNPARIFVQ